MDVLRGLGLSLLIVLGPYSGANAALWYVDNAATGANDGTSWTDAWQSFAAINWTTGVDAGDTIYISGGSTSKTYAEQLSPGDSGTVGNPITIQTGQETNHNGIVDLTGSDTRINCIRIIGRSYITVSGEVNGQIRMRCHDATENGITVSAPVGLKILWVEVYDNGTTGSHHGIAYSSNSSASTGNEIGYCNVHDNYQDQIQGGTGSVTAFGYLEIHHCTISNLSDDGIQSGGGTDVHHNVIAGARVPPLGSGHPDGVQLMGGHTRVYNNTFGTMPTGANSHAFLDPINYNGAIVEEIWFYNNVMYGAGVANNCLVLGGDTPFAPGGLNNVYVMNNTAVDCGGRVYDVGPGKCVAPCSIRNTHVKNNISFNAPNVQQCIWASPALWQDGGSGPPDYTPAQFQIDYNTCAGQVGGDDLGWQGTNYAYDTFVSNGYGQTNGRHVTPTFVSYTEDSTTNDLHLASTDTSSIDFGTNLSAYLTDDRDDKARPVGTAWDIGAYEFGVAQQQEAAAGINYPHARFRLRGSVLMVLLIGAAGLFALICAACYVIWRLIRIASRHVITAIDPSRHLEDLSDATLLRQARDARERELEETRRAHQTIC